MLIYIFLPLILIPAIFIKNKNLSCLWCGIILFLVSALSFNAEISGFYSRITAVPVSALPLLEESPGVLYFGKFFSMFIPDFPLFYILICFVNTFGTMLYINKYCYYPAPSAVAMVIMGYWFAAVSEPILYMGVMFAAFAFRYASEKRFVRFTALMLLGVCFFPVLLYIIPLYLIAATKPRIIHIVLGIASGAALIYFDFGGFFSLLGIEDYTVFPFYEYFPVLSISVCVLVLITKKIVARRNRYNETMITVALISAVLSMGMINDPRFFIFAFICFFPAGVTLVPEIISVLRAIISLTFKDKKRPVLITGGIILAALAVLLYGNILLTNAYGGIPFETWVGMEAIQ